MPLVATRGAASAQGFGEFAQSGPANYIEDVFSTWLYNGTGSTQAINNGIDLAGKGGLVWTKIRTGPVSASHFWVDTARGADYGLASNSSGAQTTGWYPTWFTGFTSTGYGVASAATENNATSSTYVSWTFRKQPKFFDVVTYTGTGAAQTINHNLGSVPGCIIIKTLSTSDNWRVYHRSIGNQYVLTLNSNLYQLGPSAAHWNNTDPTSTQFTVGTNGSQSSTTYVAYLFAHNAGGFGLTGSDNVISCGSYTGGGPGSNTTVTLGYEPQWVLIKRSDALEDWNIGDNMRGSVANNSKGPFLWANNSGAEASYANAEFTATATGFQLPGSNSGFNALGGTYIYVAIRRGPMKTPTSGTSVYAPFYANYSEGAILTSNFPVDLSIWKGNTVWDWSWDDRLRGTSTATNTGRASLASNSTAAENNGWAYLGAAKFDNNTGVSVSYKADSSRSNQASYSLLRRAPSFFDEVCYTGTGVNGQTFNHNLGVAPELLIVKKRFESPGVGGSPQPWVTLLGPISSNGNVKIALLNQDTAAYNDNTGAFSSEFYQTMPSASVFTLGNSSTVNRSTYYFVAYLFATCAGVSKVGSYTGTGALQTINCGFTGGARFVLIKRTDSTGDWYVYTSAQGISSGNDPYSFMNSTAALNTGTNYVDTTSVGFQVTAAAPAGLNANGGTYIFLAIA